MDALRQRLKELDPHSFEMLCFHILKDKHPPLKITHVEGASGDMGLDVFEGVLSERPAIWQCKSFPNGVSKSQKDQIRKSLREALRHFRPHSWILCLSIDMDAAAHRWFQSLQKSYRSKAAIGLFSASDLLHELIHRRSIRNHFFPGAVLDPTELKALVSRSGELTFDELSGITESNLEQYVERLKGRDARCRYEIVFDGDGGPPNESPLVRPGLMASFSNGQRTINVFARDAEALRSNPPSFKFEIAESAVSKYRQLIRTGAAQEFSFEELGPIKTNWPILETLLDQPKNPKDRLILSTSPTITQQTRSVRVTFRNSGLESIEYPIMELHPTRVGTEEAELRCSGDNVPFDISLVIYPYSSENRTVLYPQIGFTFRFSGSRARDAKKALDAMTLLHPCGQIEVFDLKEEQMMYAGEVAVPDDEVFPEGTKRIVDDLARIAQRFNADVRIPREMASQELETILFLNAYAAQGAMRIGNIAISMVKEEWNRELGSKELAFGRGVYRFARPGHQEVLFGTPIDIGPSVIEVECEVVNASDTLKRFDQTALGDDVEITFRTTAAAQFRLLTGEQWEESIGLPFATIARKND